MSLDDQFNKSNSSMVEDIDRFFFIVNRKIAEYWQDKTHRPKRDLERILYSAASIFQAASALNSYQTTGPLDPMPYAFAFVAGLSAKSAVAPKDNSANALTEGMEFEAMGFSKEAPKFLRLVYFGISQTLITNGIMALYGTSPIFEERYAPAAICFGIGSMLNLAASYISMSDIGDPKPKKKKEPAMKRIREKLSSLLPQPIPEPAPVRIYNRTATYSN